jgi:hypothetical protein
MADMIGSGQEPMGGRLWRSELIATLLLGLAAVGAGWAAYQAARWGSDQTFPLDRVNRARREATLIQNKANLLRVIDVGMFISYAQAVSQGNKLLANFLLERFRPPMKTAVRAWLATKPLQNPDAPPSPFVMKEYRLQEDEDARRLEEEAEQILSAAQRENKISDNYVLVTVPFAIVSLFCGLSTKFWVPGIRTAVVTMAFIVFVGAVVALLFMPVS